MSAAEEDYPATHYRHFVEAASRVSLAPVPSHGRPPAQFCGETFFVSFVGSETFALSAPAVADGRDWTPALRRQRRVTIEFGVNGAGSRLLVDGRAKLMGQRPHDRRSQSDPHTVLVRVDAAYYRRSAEADALDVEHARRGADVGRGSAG